MLANCINLQRYPNYTDLLKQIHVWIPDVVYRFMLWSISRISNVLHQNDLLLYGGRAVTLGKGFRAFQVNFPIRLILFDIILQQGKQWHRSLKEHAVKFTATYDISQLSSTWGRDKLFMMYYSFRLGLQTSCKLTKWVSLGFNLSRIMMLISS